MTDLAGRLGIARSGEHRGWYIEVERDPSWTGWHIWVSREDPRLGPSKTWDIWADDEEQVRDWLGVDEMSVEWIT